MKAMLLLAPPKATPLICDECDKEANIISLNTLGQYCCRSCLAKGEERHLRHVARLAGETP